MVGFYVKLLDLFVEDWWQRQVEVGELVCLGKLFGSNCVDIWMCGVDGVMQVGG